MNMDNFWAGFGIIGIIIGLVLLVLYCWSVVWAYKDANRRGKPGWMVAILVALMSWPLGLVLWLLFRPNTTNLSHE
ncbi:hypothetical protein JAO76_13115 [Pontibacter sp. BT310]|uniref:Cardiolipin synthase N-terminal domain-containing protein n=2 Tax=Hymenobacteraceae TaxID=1853232 RepID=A0ABS6XDN8_9BACT|nr:hypothetical protein [Pontibacter sp. BT310]MBW3365996.1 hypothetical protein [Pontibacter populi]